MNLIMLHATAQYNNKDNNINLLLANASTNTSTSTSITTHRLELRDWLSAAVTSEGHAGKEGAHCTIPILDKGRKPCVPSTDEGEHPRTCRTVEKAQGEGAATSRLGAWSHAEKRWCLVN
jgi:hypothetical protein